MGEPAILNTHAHREQPQPQKSDRSIHTNSRRIASRAHLPLVRLGFVKRRRGIGFHRDDKAAFSVPRARFGASYHAEADQNG